MATFRRCPSTLTGDFCGDWLATFERLCPATLATLTQNLIKNTAAYLIGRVAVEFWWAGCGLADPADPADPAAGLRCGKINGAC